MTLHETFVQWSIDLFEIFDRKDNIELAIKHYIKTQPNWKNALPSLLQKHDKIILQTFRSTVELANASKQRDALKATISSVRNGFQCKSQQFHSGIHRVNISRFDLNNQGEIFASFDMPRGSVLVYLCAIENEIAVAVFRHNGKTIVLAVQGHKLQQSIILLQKVFPKETTLSDFDPTRRMLIMLHSNTKIEVYAFNESYKVLEHKKQIPLEKLGCHLPIKNMLLFGGNDNGFMILDGKGETRLYQLRSVQTTTLLGSHGNDKSTLVKVESGAFVLILTPSQDDANLEIKTVDTMDQCMLPEMTIDFPHEWEWVNTEFKVFGTWLVMFDMISQSTIVYELKITTGKQAWYLHSMQGDNEKDGEHDHLLWCFFHCFEKFPIRSLMGNISTDKLLHNPLTLCINAPSEAAKQDVLNALQAIMVKLKAQNKPLYDFDLVNNVVYTDNSIAYNIWTLVSMRVWILELIGFVPVPICRARENQLVLLRHGTKADYDGRDANTLAHQIDFGPISQVLQWWIGPVVVITSMGKQSTGKSYFLNHLTGSSFATSGARCTDGVWITIRPLDKCLVVVLDFEGLGSFERTAQEDMFLSILNAAVSRLTVFRIEMRFDKDIDSMFNKFQQGVSLLKGDDRLFQGKIFLNAKDVNPNDQISVITEFHTKLQKILNENKSDNFISAMYGGNVAISCAPPIGNFGYYAALNEAFKWFDEARVKKAYKNGHDFYDCLTTVLAKIYLLHWTGMESLVKQKRSLVLREAVGIALRSGLLIEGEVPTNKCTDIAISDQYKLWMQTHEGEDALPLDCEVNFQVDLYENDMTKLLPVVRSALLDFATLFFQATMSKRTSVLERNFDALLNFIIWRREYLVRKWFGTLSNVTADARDNLDKCITKLKHVFHRCQHSCDHCQLGCFDSILHNSAHDCGTNHLCEGVCNYCSDTIDCGLPAGHTGSCNCIKNAHTCAAPCLLSGAGNCEKVCHLLLPHDGVHLCSVPFHSCGEYCDGTACRNVCVVPFQQSHKRHNCGEGHCQHLCSYDECGNTCMSTNHFHLEDAIHDCEKQHRCQEECNVLGICEMKVHLEETIEIFHGRRSVFNYVSKEMNGTRKQCSKKLNVGTFDHDDNEHVCDTKIHSCTEQCPCCEYYCEKEFGHVGYHKTSHGNMKKAHFISDTTAFDIGEKKYEARETGIAEMCPYFFSQMGRGHVHYIPCMSASSDTCVNGTVGRRHCTINLHPTPNTQMDEVLHDDYWKAIGWEDPVVSKTEQTIFGLCPYKCSHDDHANEDEVSYCVLNAWHPPLTRNDLNVQLQNHTTIKGHLFACSHQCTTSLKHHIFVLDSSGSMQGNAWKDLMRAVREYLSDQLQRGGQEDIVSIITFSHQAQLVYHGVSIGAAQRLEIPFLGSSTHFRKGLRLAHEVLSKNNYEKYAPVMLFFSDGNPQDMDKAIQAANHLSSTFDAFGLLTFCIGFGQQNHSCLKRMSELMGGSLIKANTGLELVHTFKQIALSVQARTGLYASNAVAS